MSAAPTVQPGFIFSTLKGASNANELPSASKPTPERVMAVLIAPTASPPVA